MPSANRTVTPFAGDIVRREMCAFIPGYFKFIAETEVTVQSIIQFMRGMRVIVAVHPTDIFVYQKCVAYVFLFCFCAGVMYCFKLLAYFVGCFLLEVFNQFFFCWLRDCVVVSERASREGGEMDGGSL